MKVRQALAGAALAISIPLVSQFEGLRQKAYIDPVGIPTVCFGHTGPEVKLGQSLTLEECNRLLIKDLQIANDAVNSCVTYPLEPYQRAAFVSFTYNVGGSAFCKSTLVRRVNAGDLPAACAELDKWVYAKGIKLPGLVRRRASERTYCEGAIQ